jgi:hypothetical protein
MPIKAMAARKTIDPIRIAMIAMIPRKTGDGRLPKFMVGSLRVRILAIT